MGNILLTNIYKETPYEIINSYLPKSFQLIMPENLTEEALMTIVPDADYLLVSGRLRISEKVISKAARLKMIQRTGVGLDSIDLDSIKKRNIPLYVNQGVNAESVAEHTLLLMLACLRKLTIIDKNTKNGVWKKQEQGIRTHELRGKTIGVIGMGNIARLLVRLLNGFDVKILYNDSFSLDEDYEKAHNMVYAEKEDIFRSSDIITFHCPLTDETKGMVNKDTIGMMKDGVILVNTARGSLICTQDLAESLENGKVAFAGIDVYEEEPVSKESPLLELENVVLTPHIGGITHESFEMMMRSSLRNIEMFDKGELDKIADKRIL